MIKIDPWIGDAHFEMIAKKMKWIKKIYDYIIQIGKLFSFFFFDDEWWYKISKVNELKLYKQMILKWDDED